MRRAGFTEIRLRDASADKIGKSVGHQFCDVYGFVNFVYKKGDKLSIDYRHVNFSKWAEPIRFDEIAKCTASESLGKKYLRIDYTRSGKQAHEKFSVSGFSSTAEQMLEAFNAYYSRHLASRAYQKTKEAETPVTSAS